MKRKNDLLEKTYTDVRYRIALHILFWIFMFASYYYFNTISFNPVRDTPGAYLLALKNTVEFALAFYALMYFIWPRYLVKRKWFKSLLLVFVWLVAVTALDAWADLAIFNGCESCMQRLAQFNPDYYHFLQRNFPNIVFIRVLTGGLLYHLTIQLGLPIAIKLGRGYFRQTVQGLQLAKDNLQLEFNFLKSQVNPHFLFNTLNNIYSLVVNEKKDRAAETLSRLSGFLRYTLYETGEEKIALEKEVRLLKDYIELEKLRLNETGVQFQYETDRDDYTVPPLLFMPALENAFKYTEDKNDSTIAVSIKAKEKHLQVTIQNSIGLAKNGKAGGIGLQNLQKRVQHYYPGQSSYSASAANGVYLFQLSCALA
ncbi:sensor histidine kinase [Flavisolibacter nicotianae]|uniref:sensor histidine kinase n=1 Tax=Flavisolibacter nicotianae TaxID=2364882 RepID=UPI000EB183A0|nr:sensor histidine kinase [Flavisolibacter nicotianae]